MKAKLGNVEFDIESEEDMSLLMKIAGKSKIVDTNRPRHYKKRKKIWHDMSGKLAKAVKLAHSEGINYSIAFKSIFGRKVGGSELLRMKEIARAEGWNPADVMRKHGW